VRQFDLYPNPSPRSRAGIPYVIVLQSHLLDAMPTVVVAPVIPDDGRSAYAEASVRFDLDAQAYVISVPELVAIDAHALQRSVANLAEHEDAIRRAIERVFTGF
jgi:toxin CcdB